MRAHARIGVVGAAVVLGWCAGGFAQEHPQQPTTPGAPSASPPRAPEQPAARALAGVKSFRDIEYASPDGKPVKLDLYVPEHADKPMPLVIWIHGGGWRAGTKDQCPALALTRDGFAVASVEYRLTDRACFPAQIHDCKAAVRYLRAHAKEHNIDADRIGCWGASAGGHLVALLGTSAGDKACEGAELGNADQSSEVQCVCDWFGPTDFVGYKAESADVAPMLVGLFGGKMSEKPDLVKLASPALHVKKDGAKYPPFLIVQGDKDPLVPWQQSQELADKLKEAGAAAELVIVKDAGHGFGEKNGEELQRVKGFFEKQLLKKEIKDEKAPPSKAG